MGQGMIAATLCAVLCAGAFPQERPRYDLIIELVRPEMTWPVYAPGQTEPLSMKLTVVNMRVVEGTVEAPVPKDFTRGISIQRPDGKFILRGEADTAGLEKRALKHGEFFGARVDLGPLLEKAPPPLEDGFYTIRWQLGEVTAPAVTLVVMRPTVVRFETNRGEFAIQLFPHLAPRTVMNFVKLVKENFYVEKGNTFHRILPDKLIQGGSPTGQSAGGTDPIRGEFNPLGKHLPGAISMARAEDPDSGSCQFFVCADACPEYDGNYAVFGQTVDARSLAVVRRIAATETSHHRCPKCNDQPCKEGRGGCDGKHHDDRPQSPVVIKKVTLEVMP
jgi:cyclophilin family peptidyl-prolyl cis-trans isomerase